MALPHPTMHGDSLARVHPPDHTMSGGSPQVTSARVRYIVARAAASFTERAAASTGGWERHAFVACSSLLRRVSLALLTVTLRRVFGQRPAKAYRTDSDTPTHQ